MQMWPEGQAGVEIKIDGFSHKLPLLVDYIFQQLVSLKVDPDRFDRVREGLVRRYKNANFKPDKHATYLRIYAIKQKMWPVEQVQAELEALSPTALQGQSLTFTAACLLLVLLQAFRLFISIVESNAAAAAAFAEMQSNPHIPLVPKNR